MEQWNSVVSKYKAMDINVPRYNSSTTFKRMIEIQMHYAPVAQLG